MKIAVTGYSGSGKSTLCRELSQTLGLPALHLDAVQFLPGWEIRQAEEQQEMVSSFLDSHREGWVIDGNYASLCQKRRLEEADLIVQLLFGRFSCLCRCLRRYRRYRGASRPDMTPGCREKMDWEFLRWILWDSRTKKTRARYEEIRRCYVDKVILIKNQRQLEEFTKKFISTLQ